MDKRKVVTLCGSVKFYDKMQEINEKLALENEYVVIGLTPRVTNRNFTEHDKELLGELHRAKIDLSDAIFVVNVDGYIGKSTRGEIEYAKKRGKEIMYLGRNYMIDIARAKIVHTYHVAENAKKIAQELNLSKEDIELAELIGILHDIGRFEELKITKELNSVKFDHAGHGSKMLFEKGMIRKFIEDSQYDNIIKKAIENHSRLEIEENLDERTLLHSKIIRDADKINNYRVKKDEKIEAIFPKRVNKIEDMEESNLSDKVYNTILDKKCVDIHDRVTPLDF